MPKIEEYRKGFADAVSIASEQKKETLAARKEWTEQNEAAYQGLRFALAAIEDAGRWKFENNTWYWQDESTLLWHEREHKQVPAAVRAVLEVTGGGE